MKEIFINIDETTSEGIFTRQDNNNAEVYKIYIISNEGKVNLDGKSVKMGYNFSGTNTGDILVLNVTDGENGEITLPITNKLTRKDGVFHCQLAIYGEDGYLENSSKFTLTVEKSVFSKITEGIEDIKGLTYIENLLEEARKIGGNLKVSITTGNILNDSLEENIVEGNSLKNTLEGNINEARDINVTLNTILEQTDVAIIEVTQKKEELEDSINEADIIDRKLKATVEDAKQTNSEATFKNAELKETLRETLEVINNLDESQDIPGLNKKITELQNGLKSNQSLEYEGNFIDCENTIESRTEGMKIKGRTVLAGDKLVSFGEAERVGDKYKITIQSHSFNFWNIDNIKEQNGTNIDITGDNKKFTVISGEDNGFYIKLHAKAKEKYVFSGTIKSGRAINYRIMTADFRTLSGGVFGELGAFSISHTPSEDMDIIARIWLAKSSTPCECENFYFGLSKDKGQPYIEDRKEILLAAPLRSVDDVQDVIFEEEGEVKVTRNIDTYTFTGDEAIRDTTENNEKSGTGKYKVFTLTVNKTIDIKRNINNKFPKKQFSTTFQNMDSEGLAVTQYGIYIKILKSKLSTQDIEGIKAWLKENTTAIYYVSTEPLTEVVKGSVDIDLDTFQGKTYFHILNLLPGTLDFRVPSNLGTMIQNMSKEINNIWDVIDMLVSGLLDTKKELALKIIKNNLK